EPGVVDARLGRHVAEAPTPLVVKQAIAVERGDVEVVAPVVVVVADRDSHAVHLDVEAAAAGGFAEGPVVVVEVGSRRRPPAPGLPVAAVDEQDVEPAVSVGVEEGATGTQRLGQVLLACPPAVVNEVNAGLGGHVGEADAGARCAGWGEGRCGEGRCALAGPQAGHQRRRQRQEGERGQWCIPPTPVHGMPPAAGIDRDARWPRGIDWDARWPRAFTTPDAALAAGASGTLVCSWMAWRSLLSSGLSRRRAAVIACAASSALKRRNSAASRASRARSPRARA